MTVDDLLTHFKVAKYIQLTSKVGVTRGTISKWKKNGIPIDTQARIQITTKGELIADLEGSDTKETSTKNQQKLNEQLVN